MNDFLAGGLIFGVGLCTGSAMVAWSSHIAIEVLQHALDSKNYAFDALSSSLTAVSSSMASMTKKPSIPTEKTPALFIGPDGKAYTADDVEKIDARMTSVVDEAMTAMEESQERAKEMMA